VLQGHVSGVVEIALLRSLELKASVGVGDLMTLSKILGESEHFVDLEVTGGADVDLVGSDAVNRLAVVEATGRASGVEALAPRRVPEADHALVEIREPRVITNDDENVDDRLSEEMRNRGAADVASGHEDRGEHSLDRLPLDLELSGPRRIRGDEPNSATQLSS